jgi:type I restriction enzyme S subunit
LFPDSFEGSELGPIPKGWKVAQLKEIADVNARSISKSYPHNQICYVDISSVSQGNLDQTTIYELADAPSRAKRLVKTGDTIWSCVRPNRKTFLYIDQPADNLVVSTGFAVLSPRKVPPSYMHELVTTQTFVDYLTTYATGAAYPAVRADTFETAKILYPDNSILMAFSHLIDPLRARITQNQRQNRTLAALRDTLLPKLMSGELKVPDAERIVGRVI